MSTGLILQSVTISVGQRTLISNLDLTVRQGSVVTVMGPSGSGKSTLISFIGGHLEPAFRATGQVLIDSRDVTRLPPERRGIGILVQDDLLFPHLSVGANLAFGLASGVGSSSRHDLVNEALAEADLKSFYNRDPATLSGGQRARAALMRTLLSEPKALLLDEPFSKLDIEMRREFRRFVFDRAAAKRLPVLLVTHDPDDAEAAAGQTLILRAESLENPML
jgi:putative thiamine transport system ATP-binding protein